MKTEKEDCWHFQLSSYETYVIRTKFFKSA